MKKYLITLLILVSISGPWTMNPVLKAEEMSLAKADIDKTNESQSVDMSQLMDLMKFDGMEIVNALKYLSIRSGMNIVTGKTVTGRVTMILKNVSIQDIFDIILLSNNLAYKKLGTIYYVMTAKDYADLYGESFTDAREIRVFRLKYAIPQKAFELLDILKSKVGKLLADLDSGTILVVDTPEKIAEMEKVLKIAEQKNETGVFSLQYAKAKDIEALLKARIEDKNLGSVSADERSNQVLIQTLPERMADVEQMIAVLDKKTKEVLIDTKIIKIQLFDEFDAGFEWEGMFKSLGAIGSAGSGFIGSHPLESVLRTGTGYLDTVNQFSPTGYEKKTDYTDTNPLTGSKNFLSQNVHFGRTSGKNTYEAVINLLQQYGETRLLSNPKIAVVNNQEANIHVGRLQPYVTTTTTTGQTTTTTAEDPQFIKVGIMLHVTPTINDDGFITMNIKPEVSSIVGWLVTPIGNRIPIQDTSLAETTIMVKDNSTIIIGGLRREEEHEKLRQVPGLGKIPLIGKIFFTTHHTQKQHSELLIMITPRIITGEILVTAGDAAVRPGDEASKTYRDYGKVKDPLEEPPVELEIKPYKEY